MMRVRIDIAITFLIACGLGALTNSVAMKFVTNLAMRETEQELIALSLAWVVGIVAFILVRIIAVRIGIFPPILPKKNK